MRTDTAESFDEFMKRREEASTGYIQGDATALASMLTLSDPATFMPPGGAVVEGAVNVTDAQTAGAAAFGPRSAGHLEILNIGTSGDLAFWTGRQVATMDIKGQKRLAPMVLRTTEVFRREGGQWRLVHRHADIPPATQGE